MTRPATLDYPMPADAADTNNQTERACLAVKTFRIVATLGIAVWLGSLTHLLLTVATLFAAFPKATSTVAVQAAPAVFHASERAALIVGAITLAAAVAWNWRSPTRARRWIAWLLAAATVLAVVQTTIVSAKMDALREQGESGSDAFRSLHGVSSSQYLVQTALLLVAAGTLPAALTREN